MKLKKNLRDKTNEINKLKRIINNLRRNKNLKPIPEK